MIDDTQILYAFESWRTLFAEALIGETNFNPLPKPAYYFGTAPKL